MSNLWAKNKEYGDKGLVFLRSLNSKTKVFNRHAAKWNEWMPNAIDILNKVRHSCTEISSDEAQGAFNYALNYCTNTIISERYGISKRKGIMIAAYHLASALDNKTEMKTDTLFRASDVTTFRIRAKNTGSALLYPPIRELICIIKK